MFLLLLSSAVCEDFQNSEKNESDVVASVGNIKITVDEFTNSYEFGPAFVKRKPDSKLNYLNYMVNEKLLSLYAHELGLDSTNQVKETITDFENDLATELMFKKEILPLVKYTKEEIDSVVVQKSLELEIRWLFEKDENNITKVLSELRASIPFDSLFQKQINDSVFYDTRSMKISRYDLGKKNPVLASIVDTLQIGNYSAPIKTNDGWYIIELNNVTQNMIMNETDLQKYRDEAVEALSKKKMEKLSDGYIEKLYDKSNPVVHKNVFNIALVHTANFVLSKESYNEWGLSDLLKKSVSELGDVNKENIGNLELVSLNGGGITLNEFIIWFRNRIEYIKFDKTSLNRYGYSLFDTVQRMIRDRLLTKEAYKKGYQHDGSVQSQMKNWRDKILFSAVRNELMNSIYVNNNELNYNSNDNTDNNMEKVRAEFSIKLYRLLKELTGKYNVSINKEILQKVKVTNENDPHAIDLYTVKKEGIIPRTPYPTIDNDWQYWQ